jgi:hypothetical protein
MVGRSKCDSQSCAWQWSLVKSGGLREAGRFEVECQERPAVLGFGADVRRRVIRAEWLEIGTVSVERPIKDDNPNDRDPVKGLQTASVFRRLKG